MTPEEAVRAYFAAYSEGRPEQFDEIVAPDYVDYGHTPPGRGPQGARDDYEVHVYQVGWRLGGKGASGRNPLQGQRIEEHGLHIWSGFYDNAFRAMRECFDEIRTWRSGSLRRGRDRACD